MRTLSSEYVSGANDNIRNINFSVKNVDNEIMYSSSKIISVSVQKSITDGSVGIGYTQSDRLNLQVFSDQKIPRKTWLKVYVSFDEFPETLLGWFASDECVRDGSAISITAYDAMYYQSKKKVKFKAVSGRGLSELSFPCAMQDVLDYICQLRNFTCDFQCQPFTVEKLPQKEDESYYTVRELLGFIAACHGCNVKLDAEGHLQFKSFEETDHTATSADVIDLTIDDSEPYEVTGVLFTVDNETTIYIDDVPGSDYDEDDPGVITCFNPLATVEIAEYVWTQIGGLSYYGGGLTQRGKAIIEVGDVISVGNLKYPDDDRIYPLCVTSINYSISADNGFTEVLGSEVVKGGSQMSSGAGSSSGGGSGTGKFLDSGKTSVAHNDLKNNTSTCLYDHIEGYDNHSLGRGTESEGELSGHYANRVAGYKNTSRASRCIDLKGSGNQVNNSNDSDVNGYTNTATTISNSYVNGSNITCTTITDSFISGYNCTFTSITSSYINSRNITVSNSVFSVISLDSAAARTASNINYSVIVGMTSENIQNIRCSLVISEDIKANYVEDSLISGAGNNIDGQSLPVRGAVVGGSDNDVTASYCGVVGEHHTANFNSALYCGSGAIGSINSKYYYIAVGGGSKASPQNIFTVDTAGNVQAAGSFGTIGADYAEYSEWLDGNPDNEDRCGLLVSLKGDKIVPADGDDILGAISGRASVVGNAYESYWHGKYITDVYGRLRTGVDGKPLISPEYDESREYIPRSQRPEWDPVGMVGRLIVRDNGKCGIGGYVSARNGIAVKTYARTGIRVLRRVDDAHVEVLIK